MGVSEGMKRRRGHISWRSESGINSLDLFPFLFPVPIPITLLFPPPISSCPPLLALLSHAKIIQQGQAQTHKSYPRFEGCPSRSDFR